MRFLFYLPITIVILRRKYTDFFITFMCIVATNKKQHEKFVTKIPSNIPLEYH